MKRIGKIDLQPYIGNIMNEMALIRSAPKDHELSSIATKVPLLFAGIYSDIHVLRTGIKPPVPRPPRKRKTIMEFRSHAKEQRAVKSEYVMIVAWTVFFLPILSAK